MCEASRTQNTVEYPIRPIQEHELRNAKESNLFHYAQKHVHQTCKKIVILPFCERVLFCAFDAQNRVQFAWPKCCYKREMDKRSGFWQVDLTPNAQELLAFITP